MNDRVKPLYANVVTFKVSANDLVLDFGAFFPSEEGAVHSRDDVHTVIVLPVDLIDSLAPAFEKIKAERNAKRNERSADTGKEKE